ncbi:hypothetical protein [Streptomyces phaeochromogenes]|uniref:hypothetical protein n=1 Tax=Streptomyces phaeochromogenes TaxID=1923 RepID=UPI002DDC715F|nr:hypothetical protein [Streptomyces phaeochromogenes]WRZ28217.1 hypothetical protein OG931_10875 [Streptomyces phaeochromogenes]
MGETPSPIRRGSLVLLVLGSVLAAVGVVGDALGWWARQPFFTNLVSSITGFAFAVPVALLILSRVAEAQARDYERRAALAFTQISVASFLTSYGKVLQLQDALTDIALNVGRFSFGGSQGDREAAAGHLQGIPGRHRADLHDLCGGWAVLRESARPRLAQAGVQWLYESEIAAIADSLIRANDAMDRMQFLTHPTRPLIGEDQPISRTMTEVAYTLSTALNEVKVLVEEPGFHHRLTHF